MSEQLEALVEASAASRKSLDVMTEKLDAVEAKNLENEARIQELRELMIRLDESKSTLFAQHMAGVLDGVSASVSSQVSGQVERLQADIADARQEILGTLLKN
jgi:hypothetical protein